MTIKPFSSKDLVSDGQIVKLLKLLESENLWRELVWTVLVTITGRRFKDISRMKWCNIQLTSSGVYCLVNKDKASQGKSVNFGFSWSDWDLKWNLNSFKKWFLACKKEKNKPGFVVENVNIKSEAINMKQRIKRRGGWRMHSLRNRKAIIMLIAGKSEENTRAKIGWRSMTSLYRYTIMNHDEISKCSNYEECRKLILNNRND